MMINNTNRRDFLKLMGLGTLISLSPISLSAATTPHIVIVGGGFAGATCAKYLKMWGGDSVDVTVIEENSSYISPILSNLVLNSQKTTSDLTFSYTPLKDTYKVNVINKTLSSITSSSKSISLSDGTNIQYDKLVLAPGIDFEYTNSYDISKITHAWKSGDQVNLLKDQIQNLKNGDTFVMSIPKAPFRCPPGPYERACVIADYLKNTKNITVEVIVLDENSDIIVEKDSFKAKFDEYGINYMPSSVVSEVNDSTNTIQYVQNEVTKTLSADVINVIPNQKAAKIIFDAGLNSGNWAPVDTISYESTIQNDIHIIGDSQGSSQPKAGHIANSEAKVCADAILRKVNNEVLFASPKTNSACYSPVSSNEATWLTAVYNYNSSTKDMQLANTTDFPASGTASSSNYDDMFLWSGNLFSDTFK